MSDVTVIKMINGEQIIGKVKSEDAETVQVEKPVIVMLSQKQMVLVFKFKWVRGIHLLIKPIAINKQSIMYVAGPNTELLNSYNTNFGSGLVVLQIKKLTQANF